MGLGKNQTFKDTCLGILHLFIPKLDDRKTATIYRKHTSHQSKQQPLVGNTEKFILGDISIGNIYLDRTFKYHSGITFDNATTQLKT